MRHQTKALLTSSRNEKDVENAYRAEILHHRPTASMDSPHGTDGYAQWKDVRALLEFKYDIALKGHRDQCDVLGQMIMYLKKFETAGAVMPNVLFVGDKNECFALETAAVQRFLALPIDWSTAPSAGSPALTKALIEELAISPFVFDVSTCEFKDVLDKVETLSKGEVHRVKATLGNVGAMFVFWQDNVFLPTSGLTAVEQVDVFLKCLFKPEDVTTQGSNKNILLVDGRKIPINGHQWRSFVGHFVRGYKPSEVEAFYANKDRLIEDDARRRQGAFFTPTLWVNEAHRMIEKELGANWRDECIVWDPAAGTGNLTRDYQFRDLIISTAEKPDVEVIKEQGYNHGASIFAYDFLNDDSSPFFDGKNVIPDKVEAQLRAAAKAGKRLVFLMNPPYGTAGTAEGKGKGYKTGIAKTSVNTEMRHEKVGLAARQLFTQFMFRAAKLAEQYDFKQHTVAIYSKAQFLCSGSYQGFREFWYKRFAFKAGMLFQANHFADVSGAWGISFTIWNEGKMNKITEVPFSLKDVMDFAVIKTADKAMYNSDGREASEWVREPTKGMKPIEAPQMSSGLTVTKKKGWLLAGSLLNFNCHTNNLNTSGQLNYLTSLCSTGFAGVSVLPGESFRRATALYAARKLVAGTWVNDKDEYLRPADSTDAYKQWNDDAIIYALLHNSNNCTAMRNVTYKGKSYRIKNHFWWKTRKESKALYDQPGCNELTADLRAETEDAYLSTILPTLNLSPEASTCLKLLNGLLVETLPHRESFATSRPELHLTTHDAGLYQLKHLFREHAPEGWKRLQEAFKALGDKLRPGVYDHGFLRR